MHRPYLHLKLLVWLLYVPSESITRHREGWVRVAVPTAATALGTRSSRVFAAARRLRAEGLLDELQLHRGHFVARLRTPWGTTHVDRTS